MEQGALLAYRNRATLAGRTCASLWELFPYPASAPVCIVIPPELSARRPRINARHGRLDPCDIRRRQGLPLTSPPRTILDLAATLNLYDLEQLVAEAHYRHLAREHELRDQLGRNRGKRGAAKLKRILAIPGGPQRTRSQAEVELLKLMRRAGVTGFEMNARACGYEVDVLWRDLAFAIEIDGYDAHSGRSAFERDHLKLATLTSRGVTVMPVTGRQIRRDPSGVLTRLRRGLATARATSSSRRKV
jgi:very-short-patch-repair endonuclease